METSTVPLHQALIPLVSVRDMPPPGSANRLKMCRFNSLHVLPFVVRGTWKNLTLNFERILSESGSSQFLQHRSVMALPFFHLVCAPREGDTMMLTLGTHSREHCVHSFSSHPCNKLHIIPTWMFTELSLKSNSPFFVAIRSLKLNSLIFFLTFKDAPCKVETIKVSLNFFLFFFFSLGRARPQKIGYTLRIVPLRKISKRQKIYIVWR